MSVQPHLPRYWRLGRRRSQLVGATDANFGLVMAGERLITHHPSAEGKIKRYSMSHEIRNGYQISHFQFRRIINWHFSTRFQTLGIYDEEVNEVETKYTMTFEKPNASIITCQILNVFNSFFTPLLPLADNGDTGGRGVLMLFEFPKVA